MEFLPFDDFSGNQREIIELRAEKKTYNEIMTLISRKTGLNVYPRHISLCLERSALGYKWDFGMQSGTNPYLCDSDIRKLSEIVRNANANGCSLDTLEVIDEATRLKSERLAYGLIFLKEINSLDLAQKIADQTLYSPTRSWIKRCVR